MDDGFSRDSADGDMQVLWADDGTEGFGGRGVHTGATEKGRTDAKGGEMNELAWWLADVADCIYCGKPCTEYDNDGNPIHEECKVDRDAMRVEGREQ